MIVNKIFPTLTKTMFAAATAIALMQCSEDELLTPTSAATQEVSSASTGSVASVSSLTVTGSNTTYTTLTDCKTCTYIVSPKEEIVDGKALGFKPGNIICLNKGVDYGNIELINIEGTIEKPIVIATIGNSTASPATEQEAAGDPY